MIVEPFAGPGGWTEGLRLLGHTGPAIGIEWDAAACATRAAAGHLTVRADVAAYPAERFAGAVGVIASPPCQAFSAAGKRGGAKDAARLREHLIGCAGEWADPEPPPGGWTDPRAALVLEPLRWVHAIRPTWVACEQVPPVRKLWEAMAVALDALGYRTVVGVVNAADYGVPQTRQRAVLLAHRDRWPRLPAPTHAEVATVSRARWVSMADALGWGAGTVGFARRDDRGDSPTGYRERDLRTTDRPAFALTDKARSWTLNTGRDWKKGGARADAQTIPGDRPAPTVPSAHGGASIWWLTRPATTIAGDSRVHPPGHKLNQDDRDRLGTAEAEARYEGRAGTNAVRVEESEAAALQSFPADYPWQGTRSKRFEQIGNAVPPLLAAHLLAPFVAADTPAAAEPAA